MKRLYCIVLLIYFLAVFIYPNEKKTGFYLKIYGSPTFSNSGDFKDMIDTNADFLLDNVTFNTGPWRVSTDFLILNDFEHLSLYHSKDIT